MYKMVIFDLDGTLLNTLQDLADAGNYSLSVFGFPVHDVEKYRYFVGNGIPKLIERIIPEMCDEHTKNKVYDEFCSYYEKHMNDNTIPYKGVIEMLSAFRKAGIVSVIVTNKSADFAVDIVNRYFGDLIDATYGSVEGLPKKPDPYWVNKAISDFGIDKSQILYVGDSGVDMETAENAGLASCGVTWGFRDKEELILHGARMICSDCSEIVEAVL